MDQPDLVVSNNLRRIREERNLSYTQLADLTGVSKSMLRQIEIGDSSPTINTLWKIANGLEIPFTTLVNPSSPGLSKAGFKDGSPLLGTTEGYRLYPLITFEATRSFEVYYVEIDPDVALDADPHTGHAEEIVMVIDGTIEIRVSEETISVSRNEMLRFEASYAHYYRNPAHEVARAIMIISYST